ncbi:MAG: hypothetical protein ACI8S6_001323 [Myxococcota bacterium]|jgi:hypothetical protein
MLILLAHTALALDIAAYTGVLQRHVDAQGRVDYAALHEDTELDTLTDGLAAATEPADPKARMAFWINAYNALTLDLIADNFPLGSIRELDGGDPWSARMFTVAGQPVTLNHIEHQILRPMGDARVHAALNCASRGCPPLPLKPLTGDELDAQLNDAAQRWVATNAISVSVEDNAVQLSKIFDWYGEDFVRGEETKEQAAVRFATTYLPEHADFLTAGSYTTSYMSYDWGLNSQ